MFAERSWSVAKGTPLLDQPVIAKLVRELLSTKGGRCKRLHTCPCQRLAMNPFCAPNVEVLTFNFVCNFSFAHQDLRYFIEKGTVREFPIVNSSLVEVPECPWLFLRLSLTHDADDCEDVAEPACRIDESSMGFAMEAVVRSGAYDGSCRSKRALPRLTVDWVHLRSGQRTSTRFHGWADEPRERCATVSGCWQKPLNRICEGPVILVNSAADEASVSFESGSNQKQCMDVSCAVKVWSIRVGGWSSWPLRD